MAKAEPRTASAPKGRWFAQDYAVIIFRDTGQVVNRARVLEESFRVDTPDMGVVTVRTDRIKTIVYKNLPAYPTDMLRTLGASEINGVVVNDPVHVEADDLGGQIAIPKAKIISIVW